MKKNLSIFFPLLTAGIFGIFFLLVLISPEKTFSGSNSEVLTTIPQFSFHDLIGGSFQDQFEQAVKDQFVFHDRAIAFTLNLKSRINQWAVMADNLFRGQEIRQGLISFGNIFRINGTDWLTGKPYLYDETTEKNYRRKAEEINRFAARYPKVKVYVYYCTRAEDLSWFDTIEGIHTFAYNKLLKSLLDHSIGYDELKFDDFIDYTNLMYKTDHHWNNKGAARGYADIYTMINRDFQLGEMRTIDHTDDFNELTWTGSRARESGISIPTSAMDAFKIDFYSLDDHRSWFGENEQTIGLREEYAAGEINRDIGFDQYLNYYGFESQPIRLQYEGSDPNLLIVGDSFSRAIREVLASHFGTTVYINFRILNEVNLDEIMDDFQADAVLFMGQQDTWSQYFLEDNRVE